MTIYVFVIFKILNPPYRGNRTIPNNMHVTNARAIRASIVQHSDALSAFIIYRIMRIMHIVQFKLGHYVIMYRLSLCKYHMIHLHF